VRRVIALAALPLVLPGTGFAKTYDLPSVLGKTLSGVTRSTPLPVLVPERLPLDYSRRVYPSGTGGRRSWSIALAATRSCGANACFLASFTARLGARPYNPGRVQLRGGAIGHYQPLSCGGSCSPPSIEFRRRGVLYEFQASVARRGRSSKRLLVEAANSALAAGPR
jgi:hypothetical protein